MDGPVTRGPTDAKDAKGPRTSRTSAEVGVSRIHQERDARPVLSTVLLASFGLRRELPRPVAYREVGYDARFDAETLFYDVFASPDDRFVMAVGPPFLNCAATLASATFRCTPDGTSLPYEITPHHTGVVIRIDLAGAAMPECLMMEVGGQRIEIAVQPSGVDRFAGHRVMYTLSKDNALPWIRDWAEYHVRVHGVNAIIIYDNGSQAYSADDLRALLGAIDGLRTCSVVDWCFLYGTGEGPNGEWDSDFCQERALAHMRFRFSAAAEAVLNSDVDELVLPLRGASIFTALAESGLPCLTFAGRWATAIRPRYRSRATVLNGREGTALRHTDCLYLEDEPRYPNKWVVNPALCGNDVHWRVHAICGLTGDAAAASALDAPMSQDFEFRHCRQITTNWKYERARVVRFGRRASYDHGLAEVLAGAFPDRRVFRQGGIVRRLVDFARQF